MNEYNLNDVEGKQRLHHLIAHNHNWLKFDPYLCVVIYLQHFILTFFFGYRQYTHFYDSQKK